MKNPQYGTGSLHNELTRTAEMLVDVTNTLGVYYAVALLYDSNYDTDRLKALLPILENQHGAIFKTRKPQ